MEDTTMTKTTKAYEAGKSDGRTVALEEGPSQEEIGNWLAPGKVLPDEGLINACETPRMASILGLSVEECTARGDAFFSALDAYNHGYQVGAVETITEE
jgi:hypothetical protein